MMHQLKIEPQFFEPLRTGLKRCELRKNDRNYAVDDLLIISEFILNPYPQYTGRVLAMRITHIVEGGCYGLESGWVCLSVWREE